MPGAEFRTVVKRKQRGPLVRSARALRRNISISQVRSLVEGTRALWLSQQATPLTEMHSAGIGTSPRALRASEALRLSPLVQVRNLGDIVISYISPAFNTGQKRWKVKYKKELKVPELAVSGTATLTGEAIQLRFYLTPMRNYSRRPDPCRKPSSYLAYRFDGWIKSWLVSLRAEVPCRAEHRFWRRCGIFVWSAIMVMPT